MDLHILQRGRQTYIKKCIVTERATDMKHRNYSVLSQLNKTQGTCSKVNKTLLTLLVYELSAVRERKKVAERISNWQSTYQKIKTNKT